MSDKPCPVHETFRQLDEIVASGRLTHPRNRHRAEELLDLLNDVAWGRAGESHLPAMAGLARDLSSETTPDAGAEAGRLVAKALSDYAEVFNSHVRSQNCPTGDCIRITPAPCQMACPAGIDVPTYVTLIGMGKYAEAIEVIRRDNPFPWVCGLVCTRPCEFMCVRGRIDNSISIKSMKGFAAERALSEGAYRNPEKEPDKGKKVAVVGAGPGGMTAAYYLALKGYGVTVFEALPTAGGMMMVGIPRYRLPREVIDREVAMIQDLGVELRFNARFGTDVTWDQLKAEGYEALLLAIGCHNSLSLGIPGENDFPQVLEAAAFLRKVALGDRSVPGKRVVVIGGGNVAIDAARTSLRLGSESVTIAYRRTRSEMPADEEEVHHAEQEGVEFSFLTVPVAVEGMDGTVTALHSLRAELITKEGSDRKYPVPVEGSDFRIPADVVIGAIGQRVNQDCMGNLCDLGWTRRNTIDVNQITMETSIPGIFAAGDATLGPATVVEAIGGGKRAANAIDRYLSGIPQPQLPPVPVRRERLDCIETTASTKMTLRRPEMPMLNINRRRITFQQAELGLTEEMVRTEALRCLRCDICMRCGQCVEICRDKMQINALNLGHLNFDHPVKTDFRLTAENCITCGACATHCPNEAMRIEDREGERVLSLCGTVLNHLKLNYCESCGAVLGPARYQDYIRKRTSVVTPVTDGQLLCVACARKKAALFTP